MTSKAIYVQPGGGYDKVEVGTCEAPAPKPGEITVQLHASSSTTTTSPWSAACGARASGAFPWPTAPAKWSRSVRA